LPENLSEFLGGEVVFLSCSVHTVNRSSGQLFLGIESSSCGRDGTSRAGGGSRGGGGLLLLSSLLGKLFPLESIEFCLDDMSDRERREREFNLVGVNKFVLGGEFWIPSNELRSEHEWLRARRDSHYGDAWVPPIVSKRDELLGNSHGLGLLLLMSLRCGRRVSREERWERERGT
jgi:hypothetical protein